MRRLNLCIGAAVLGGLSCTLFQSTDYLYPAVWPENRTYGYINRQGEMVIEPKFYVAWMFEEDRAVAFTDWTSGHGKAGHIDRTGAWVTEPVYDFALSYSEGLALVSTYDTIAPLEYKHGYVNKQGKLVIDIQFATVPGARESRFSEGLAAVQFSKSGPYGYIDATGTTVIEPDPRFKNAGWFRDGRARVGSEYDRSFGYIDRTGNVCIDFRQCQARDFSEGLAAVTDENDSLWGYIDVDGNWAIQPRFDWCMDFHEGLAAVGINRKGGFIDKKGEVVIDLQYEGVSYFSEGMAAVWLDGKYGFIDKQGNMKIPPRFEMTTGFTGGLAQVDGWDWIDTDGNYVWLYTSGR